MNGLEIRCGITVAGEARQASKSLGRLLRTLREVIIIDDIETHSQDVAGNTCTFVATFTIKDEPSYLTEIYDMIEADLGVSRDRIRDHRHNPSDVVEARHVIMFILNRKYHYSHRQIAKILGWHSHASSVLACRKFDTASLNGQYESQPLREVYFDVKSRYRKTKETRCPTLI